MPKGQECDNCRFSVWGHDPDEEPRLECHRYAPKPQLRADVDPPEYKPVWATVENNWCGEWEELNA